MIQPRTGLSKFAKNTSREKFKNIGLNQQQCEWLCAQTAGCHSIDMHKSKDRCFLNTEVCDVLHESADYNLLVKNVDDNTRRLQEMGRQLTAAQVFS